MNKILLYKEYDKNGEELINITRAFEDKNDLVEYIKNRIEYYHDLKKIVIQDICIKKNKGSEE